MWLLFVFLFPITGWATCPAPNFAGYEFNATCAAGEVNETCSPVSCTTGYMMLEETAGSVICNGSMWLENATDPLSGCVIVTCEWGGVFDGVHYLNPGNCQPSYGSVCFPQCGPGFDVSPTGNNITCQEDGSWTLPLSGCPPRDCGAPAVDGFVFDGCSMLYGSGECIPSNCSIRYTGSPMGGLTCNASGSWEVSTSLEGCELVDCGIPSIQGWEFASCSHHVDDICTISGCSLGYSSAVSPSGSVVCKQDGTWDNSSLVGECVLVDCGMPIWTSIFLPPLVNCTTTYSSSCIPRCSSGWMGSDAEAIVCQANGAWSMMQGCASTDCGVPIFPGYVFDSCVAGSGGSVSTFGARCNTTCAPKYTTTTSAVGEIECRGIWIELTPLQGCSPRFCSAGLQVVGYVLGEPFGGIAPGPSASAVVQPTGCEDGYYGTPSGEAVCVGPQWDSFALTGCLAGLGDGLACSDGNMCASGVCESRSNLCCDRKCDDVCESCEGGECKPIYISKECKKGSAIGGGIAGGLAIIGLVGYLAVRFRKNKEEEEDGDSSEEEVAEEEYLGDEEEGFIAPPRLDVEGDGGDDIIEEEEEIGEVVEEDEGDEQEMLTKE